MAPAVATKTTKTNSSRRHRGGDFMTEDAQAAYRTAQEGGGSFAEVNTSPQDDYNPPVSRKMGSGAVSQKMGGGPSDAATATATMTTTATATKVKKTRPLKHRGSDSMPGGGAAAYRAAQGGGEAAPSPINRPPPPQDDTYVPPVSRKMGVSGGGPPAQSQSKSSKPRPRRGSHDQRLPDGQMQNLSVAPTPPHETSSGVGEEAKQVQTYPSQQRSPQPPSSAPHDNSSEQQPPAGTGRTRARRRGSVVKSMMEGGKDVDGDGTRYAAASIGVGKATATTAKPEDRGDHCLPQSRSSQEWDASGNSGIKANHYKRPMLSQMSTDTLGNSIRTVDAGTKHSKGIRKKDIGRKAIRSVAAELNYVHKVVPKSDDAKELIYDAIRPNILFKACSPEELVDLVDAFKLKKVAMGSIVIREGDEGDHFYVMERGGVDIYEKNVHKRSLFSGVAFGEIALLYGCPRSASVLAKYDCILWVIDRRAFRGITSQHKRKRLQMKFDFLKKVKIHDKLLGDILKPTEIQSMALATKTKTFRMGKAIVRQGEQGDAFYMIDEGTVDVFIKEKGESPVVTLKSGHFFGEKALLSSDVRTATCISTSDVKCILLMREDFVLMLGNLQDLLNRSYIARDEALAEKEALVQKQSMEKMTQFNIDDFEIKRELGVGAFGFVNLVKWKRAPKGTTDPYFALKSVSLEKIIKHKQQEKIMTEAAIMRELVHPFIVRCYSVMEDHKGKYFLMESLCGGELCEILYEEEQFPESWSTFYSASVLQAFAHMHEKKIAFRDLKPENLVLNDAGYVKIVDFGLAKKIVSGQTYTFCGTPDYLAPEVILNEGYDWAVDYWGLGVLIYEMTAGVAPFCADSPMQTYEKVLSGHVPIPSHFSGAMANIIKKFLHQSQSRRFGRTVGGAMTVMDHSWYYGFDWDALMEYRMRVPYVPELKDPDDQSAYSEEAGAEGFAESFF